MVKIADDRRGRLIGELEESNQGVVDRNEEQVNGPLPDVVNPFDNDFGGQGMIDTIEDQSQRIQPEVVAESGSPMIVQPIPRCITYSPPNKPVKRRRNDNENLQRRKRTRNLTSTVDKLPDESWSRYYSRVGVNE